jgi:hypothetical protein
LVSAKPNVTPFIQSISVFEALTLVHDSGIAIKLALIAKQFSLFAG